MRKHKGNGRRARGETPAPPERRDHGRDGRFTVGNKAKTKTALRALALPPEMAHLAGMERDDLAQAIADDGGADNIARRRAQSHENRQCIQRKIRQLTIALDRFGIFDGKGHLRSLWIDKLIALVNTATRIDIALGFERRARSVDPDDVGAYISQRAEHEIEGQ